MSGYEHLHYAVADGVATIRLDRPEKLNALTSAMADEQLPELCRRATADPAVRVVVLTGTGRAFCSGADLVQRIDEVTTGADATRLEQPLANFVRAVWELPKPVIAAVNGVAAGGGMSLAAVADFRVVAESARFVPAFVRRGLMPDGGLTFTLPLLVGRPAAARILMLGTPVDPATALRLGLADEVAPDAELDKAVAEFAAQLAAGPAVALSFTKRAVQRAAASSLTQQLEFESWGQRVCLGTRDFAEGRAAFAEHRAPQFEGR
ncbi:enoyl-CoA hydratase/isomerase family protein [Dactylosporangium sp. CS-047395]|uniref:enoyl-CoA hydratase/isomerase family protein n=1 Tax=Dactylosporangium sp. CS-047395 TaxID=3239936 RepID=UPI003D8F9640